MRNNTPNPRLYRVIISIIVLAALLCGGCAFTAAPIAPTDLPIPTASPSPEPTAHETPEPSPAIHDTPEPVFVQYIQPGGMTVAERFPPPPGCERTEGNVYEEYLRGLPLLPDGSPVLLHDGGEKYNQSVHLAVLGIDVGERDLQQCADAALRLRCEFLFATGQYGRINYHLTNGDEFPYEKYREGYRLKVDGNKTALVKTAEGDKSYAAFRKYLNVLFTYAGTRSVEKESAPVEPQDMRVGDIFVKGGSPGHCVIVIDMCEDAEGRRYFMLAQSYMPAQQIHILKNPSASEPDNPWYALDTLAYPFETPEWTFEEPCLRRMP